MHTGEEIPPAWRDLHAEVAHARAPVSVYVLGALDTGKTTLCTFLCKMLSRHAPAAYIDCDPGQSTLGPPATAGMALFRNGVLEKGSIRLRFIGGTTPQGHLLQTVAAVRRLFDTAGSAGLAATVIDSSGFVGRGAAREFQAHLIDLLQPDYLVGIQRSRELEHILNNFQRVSGMQLRRLSPPPAARLRTIETRREYREQKFKAYFRTARESTFSFSSCGLRGRIPPRHRPEIAIDRLIALCDSAGFVQVLGLVQEILWERKEMRLFAPPFRNETVALVHFGSIYLEKSGRQLIKPHSSGSTG